MPRRQPSPAEQSLVDEVNRRLGTEFTARQFERWREAGYLRPLHHVWRGRKGSDSSWDDELLDEALALAAVKGKRTPLYEAAFTVFIAGGPIGEIAVKTAYQQVLDVTERFLRDDCEAEDPEEVARTVAPTMVKRLLRTKDGTRWKRRLVTAGKDPTESLHRICEAMIAVALGGPAPPTAAVEDFLAASGLAAAEHESVGGLGPWAEGLSREPIGDALRKFSIPAQRARIERTEFGELCRARDSMKQIMGLLTALAPVVKETTQTRDALGLAEFTHLDVDGQLSLLVPTVLIFEEMGLNVQRVVRLAKTFVPLYRALHPLVQGMPRYLRRFLTPDGPSRLNLELPARRELFVKHLLKTIADHPDEAAVVSRHK